MRSMKIAGLAILSMLFTITGATSATFDVVSETRSQSWSSVLYRNTGSGELFCALESKAPGTVLRVNQYLQSKDTFLELYDPTWTMIEGDVKFSLEFSGLDPSVGIELRGKSWGDSYTYDILDRSVFGTLLTLFGAGSALEIKNSNGALLAVFNLQGSSAAVDGFNSCVAQ